MWKVCLFQGTAPDSHVYFVHSYYACPEDPAVIAAEATYGDVTFCAALQKDNVMATQFHPEKSQAIGLNIIKNFGEL